MSLSGLGWWIAGGAAIVLLLGGLRWALADFLLDRFGSPLFDWGAGATWESRGAGSAGSDRP